MTPLPTDEPASNEITPAILEALSSKVKDFVQEHVYNDVDPEKTTQYAEARKSHLYWEGNQYLFPRYDNGMVVDYQSIPAAGSSGLFSTVPQDAIDRGMYDATLNYIYGDGNKFIAVLGSRAPNPKAVALRPDNEDQSRRARRADRILQSLRKLWPVDYMQRQLALFAWKDGTFFLHTPWEVDGKRYGTTKVPEVIGTEEVNLPQEWSCMQCGAVSDNSEQCPACGSVVMTEIQQEPLQVPKMGVKLVANGAPGLYAETIFTVTVSFYSRDLNDAPWLLLEMDVPKGPMIERYPVLEDEIDTDAEASASSGLSMSGMIARSIQASTFGRTYANKRSRFLYTEVYVKPETFHLFRKEAADLPDIGPVVIKDFLRERFPRGAKLIIVAKKLVDIQGAPLEDEWSFGKPGVSPYIYCHPVSRAALPIQDMINEQYNLFRETVERNIPYVLGDPTVIDFEAMRQRRGVAGELIPCLPNAGGKLSDALYKGPTATIEPEVERWVQSLIQTKREITGVLPPIFGGGEGSQTALEADQKRNQALMALALIWFGMRDAWKGAYTNGLKAIIRHGAQALARFGLDESDMAELGDMLDHDGNLNGYCIDIEEGIPITWGALRDAVMNLINLGPPVWTITGLDNPANAHRIQDALGMTDWVTPGSLVRDYVLNSVRKLLTGTATLVPDPMTGAPTLQASEKIDDFSVDPGVAIAVLSEWILSDEGQRVKDANQDGWDNILAWGMAWRRLSQQMMMPPPGAEPPPDHGQPEPQGPPQ